MASINFYLEKRRGKNGGIKTTNVPIVLYFSYDGKRFQKNTGEKTDFSKWDYEKQRLTDKSPGSEQVNAYLSSLKEEVIGLYREARLMGIMPGNSYFRENLRNLNVHSGYQFFDIFMKFIEEKSENWSIYTFHKIKTNYRHLREFSEKTSYIVGFDRINKDFYRKYIDFFREKGHTNSTIVKNLNILKWFLNWATKRGYNRNLFYRDFKFPWEHACKSDSSDMYLEWDELMDFYKAVITDDDLRRARDIFCFMCFTGLKHSQLKFLIQGSLYNSNPGLSYQGRQQTMILTLNKLSDEILGKYQVDGVNKKVLPDIGNAILNSRIKEAARLAGLNKPVNIRIFRGDEKLTRKILKYQILTTKVARNTFIFHALNFGLPLQHIMKVTGLKTFHGIYKSHDLTENTAVKEII